MRLQTLFRTVSGMMSEASGWPGVAPKFVPNFNLCGLSLLSLLSLCLASKVRLSGVR
jgi:hypothetical protein